MPPKDKRALRRDFGDEESTVLEEYGEGYGVPAADMEALVGTRDPVLIGAKKVNIFKILPDPTQPRRAMPSVARAYWTGDPASVPQMLKVWVDLAEGERGKPIIVEDYLAESYDPEAEPDEGNADQKPIESGLIEFLKFTRTLMDGLTNPVTFNKIKGTDMYKLETGERRWLGFHLLHMVSGDEKWTLIPGRDVTKRDVWRQATENSARTNLNAIGRARQIALLIMDLYEQNNVKFRPIDELVKPGECDRVFYAQVADGNEWPIPRGQGSRLLAALGLSDDAQLRQFRTLLRASDELWTLADDHNLVQDVVRKMMKESEAAKGSVKNLTPPGRKPPPPPKLLDTLRTAYEVYDETRRMELVNQIQLWLLELEAASRSDS